MEITIVFSSELGFHGDVVVPARLDSGVINYAGRDVY